MSVRVYQFGLLPPVENERLVREQLRAAHAYRNDLVAIERGRRAALRAIDAADEDVVKAEALVRAASRTGRKATVTTLRLARKAARERASEELALVAEREAEILRSARADTRCYWGSYLDVEAAHRQSRAQPLYGDDAVTPNDPAFARGPRWRDALGEADPRSEWWLTSGQVGVQLQGGAATSEIMSGQDTRVRLQVEPSRSTGKRNRGRSYGSLWLRVGSEGRDPIWARWPIKMHRAVPSSAIWKWVRVSLRSEGMRERWTVEITVDDPAPPARERDTELSGALAVEWEWSPLDDGSVRVARWADTRGGAGEVLLPARIATGLSKPAGIRSVRDTLFNDAKVRIAKLVEASREVLPSWLVAEASTMHLWKSPQRMRALAMRWRRERIREVREAYEVVDAWERRDDHLYEYESGARGEALGERREFYRVLAATWGRSYRTALLSDQDLSREARWADDSDVRFLAGPSELRLALRNVFGEDAVDAAWRDAPEEDDERPWCERCRDAWEAGGARGDGRFAGSRKKTTNAWAARRSKKKERGGEGGASRGTTAEPAGS